MADGIRIRHKTLRGTGLAVRDLSSRIDPPYPACSWCNIPAPGHEGYKTRHFMLDGEGTVVVSERVYRALLAHVDHGGFDLGDTNVVTAPPRQELLMGDPGGPRLVVHHKYPAEIKARKGA